MIFLLLVLLAAIPLSIVYWLVRRFGQRPLLVWLILPALAGLLLLAALAIYLTVKDGPYGRSFLPTVFLVYVGGWILGGAGLGLLAGLAANRHAARRRGP